MLNAQAVIRLETLRHLRQRDVRPFADQAENEGFVRIQAGSARIALLARRHASGSSESRTQLPTVDLPTHMRCAATLVDKPSSTTRRTTRQRKSSLIARVIHDLQAQ